MLRAGVPACELRVDLLAGDDIVMSVVVDGLAWTKHKIITSATRGEMGWLNQSGGKVGACLSNGKSMEQESAFLV